MYIPLPPSRGWQGLSKELWTTEWLLGQKRNSTKDPTGAVSSEGVKVSAPWSLDTRTIVAAPEVAVAGAEEVAEGFCAAARAAKVLNSRRGVVENSIVSEGEEKCAGSVLVMWMGSGLQKNQKYVATYSVLVSRWLVGSIEIPWNSCPFGSHTY